MIEFKSDIARRHSFSVASQEVKTKGYELPTESILERRDAMRAKQARKRRIPWLTIITLGACIPFMIDGEAKSTRSPEAEAASAVAKMHGNGMEDALKNPSIADSLNEGNAKMTISIGGKTYEREISAHDVRKFQSEL